MVARDSFDSETCCFNLMGKIIQFSGLSQNSPVHSRAAAAEARVWKMAAHQKEAVTYSRGSCVITVPYLVSLESLAFSASIFSLVESDISTSYGHQFSC